MSFINFSILIRGKGNRLKCNIKGLIYSCILASWHLGGCHFKWEQPLEAISQELGGVIYTADSQETQDRIRSKKKRLNYEFLSLKHFKLRHCILKCCFPAWVPLSAHRFFPFIYLSLTARSTINFSRVCIVLSLLYSPCSCNAWLLSFKKCSFLVSEAHHSRPFN